MTTVSKNEAVEAASAKATSEWIETNNPTKGNTAMEVKCPKCGSKNYEVHETGYASGHDHHEWIQCCDCGRTSAHHYDNSRCPAANGEFCSAHSH